jgi:hypothetical protein
MTESVHIRLPRSLLGQLRAQAQDEGMSTNALMLALLAGSIGFTLAPDKTRSPRAAADTAGGMTTPEADSDAVRQR